MRFVSLFSGIEAASVAWGPLGWEPMAFCEIEPFPCAVLEERFPVVPNLGDVSKVDWSGFVGWNGVPDLVVGGSPCQSFSVAGKREGLAGASGLMWEFVRACDQLRPRWVVWENVPGALSSSGGEDFRCLLESLGELGYRMAWRVLDAQFFGVAQRRRRVFLVGDIGAAGGGAAEVLLEPDGMRGDSPSSREKRAAIAPGAGIGDKGAGCFALQSDGGSSLGSNGSGWSGDGIAYTLNTVDRQAVAFAQNTRDEVRLVGGDGSVAGALSAQPGAKQQTYLAFKFHAGSKAGSAAVSEGVSPTLTADWHSPAVADGCVVRRLTPRECERLQGFPDDWTRIPWKGRPSDECPDGPRYRALGNSMAVPVMRWIGERIAAVDR